MVIGTHQGLESISHDPTGEILPTKESCKGLLLAGSNQPEQFSKHAFAGTKPFPNGHLKPTSYLFEEKYHVLAFRER